MPTYCFSCEHCGKKFTRVVSMRKYKARPKCECGFRANRDFVTEHSGTAHHPGNWPLYSDAAGVAHDQVGEAYEKSVKDGVPTQFTKDGRAILTSADHRRRYCESVGLFDRNGGYSDPRRRGVG